MGIAYATGKQDYDKAIECFEKAIELNDLAEAYFGMGIAYQYGKQDYKEAIKYYKKAIKYKPDLAEAYCGMGIAYGKQGKKKQELTYMKRAAIRGFEPAKQWLRDNDFT